MNQKDTYGEVKIFEFENMIARVHIPVLTEEERKRRLKDIEKAAISLLLSQTDKKR